MVHLLYVQYLTVLWWWRACRPLLAFVWNYNWVSAAFSLQSSVFSPTCWCRFENDWQVTCSNQMLVLWPTWWPLLGTQMSTVTSDPERGEESVYYTDQVFRIFALNKKRLINNIRWEQSLFTWALSAEESEGQLIQIILTFTDLTWQNLFLAGNITSRCLFTNDYTCKSFASGSSTSCTCTGFKRQKSQHVAVGMFLQHHECYIRYSLMVMKPADYSHCGNFGFYQWSFLKRLFHRVLQQSHSESRK